MISSTLWQIRLFARKVWVRVLGLAALAVLAIAIAPFLSGLFPSALTGRLDDEAVRQILTLLASSMLAVTTFSLSIAVNAFAAAAQNATPRVVALLQEDPTTQNVLATFLGAFLFSLLGLVALNADYVGADGRAVLFLATCAVVTLVILALIRWIGHLMSFGRMNDALNRVETAATNALSARVAQPFMGARPAVGDPPKGAARIEAERTGYVQHVDLQALSNCAEAAGVDLYLVRMPGDFASKGAALLAVDGASPDKDMSRRMARAFTIGNDRVFDDDPLFGLVVLAEIASRALSPAVNDPGTAISVIGRIHRILARWSDRAEPSVDHPRLHVPPITPSRALRHAFRPIARDGAAMIEVQLRLMKTLRALAESHPAAFAEPAAAVAADARERVGAAGLTEAERRELDAVVLPPLRVSAEPPLI
ncbi:DUF2254 domain-containing protein [Rhodobacterales bacterium HKCCE3408]|nr:DUF2254 domain-containing protein [Rhodobacterales bacterium HKCCE3408]